MLKIYYGEMSKVMKNYDENMVVIDLSDIYTGEKFSNHINIKFSDCCGKASIGQLQKDVKFSLQNGAVTSEFETNIRQFYKRTYKSDGVTNVQYMGRGSKTIYDLLIHWTCMGKDIVFTQDDSEYAGSLHVTILVEMLRYLIPQLSFMNIDDVNRVARNTSHDYVLGVARIIEDITSMANNEIVNFEDLSVERLVPYRHDNTNRLYPFRKSWVSAAFSTGKLPCPELEEGTNTALLKKKIDNRVEVEGYTDFYMSQAGSIRYFGYAILHAMDLTAQKLGYDLPYLNTINNAAADREIFMMNLLSDKSTGEVILSVDKMFKETNIDKSSLEFSFITKYLSTELYYMYNPKVNYTRLIKDARQASMIDTSLRGLAAKDRTLYFQILRVAKTMNTKVYKDCPILLTYCWNYNIAPSILSCNKPELITNTIMGAIGKLIVDEDILHDEDILKLVIESKDDKVIKELLTTKRPAKFVDKLLSHLSMLPTQEKMKLIINTLIKDGQAFSTQLMERYLNEQSIARMDTKEIVENFMKIAFKKADGKYVKEVYDNTGDRCDVIEAMSERGYIITGYDEISMELIDVKGIHKRSEENLRSIYRKWTGYNYDDSEPIVEVIMKMAEEVQGISGEHGLFENIDSLEILTKADHDELVLLASELGVYVGNVYSGEQILEAIGDEIRAKKLKTESNREYLISKTM